MHKLTITAIPLSRKPYPSCELQIISACKSNKLFHKICGQIIRIPAYGVNNTQRSEGFLVVRDKLRIHNNVHENASIVRERDDLRQKIWVKHLNAA